MDIEHIREFLVFAKAPSVSAAAKQLHLTQPTLSNHIASLENELDANLVHHGRQMSLTNAGRVFVDLGDALVKRYDSFASAVKEASSEYGELNVLLNASFAQGVYAHWAVFCHIYLSKHPKAAIHHANCNDANVSDALSDGRYDCCIVPYTVLPEDVERGIAFEELPGIGGDRLGIWIHKDNPLAKKGGVRWSDLQGCKHAMYTGTGRLWNSCVRQLFAEHGIEVEWRPIPGDMIGSGRMFREDEVGLTDDISPEKAEAIWPDWTIVPIVDEDAISRAFIAYQPGSISPALADLLSYLQDEYGR